MDERIGALPHTVELRGAYTDCGDRWTEDSAPISVADAGWKRGCGRETLRRFRSHWPDHWIPST
jgi:hypothetical protein